MVQVLPAVPSFGEKLSESLIGATEKIAQGYMKRRQGQMDQRIAQELMKGNKSPIENIILASKMSPELAKNFTDYYGGIAKEQAKSQSYVQQMQQLFPELFNDPSSGGNAPVQPPDPGSQLNQAPVSQAPPMGAPNQPVPQQPSPQEIRNQQGLSLGDQSAAAPGMAPLQPMSNDDRATKRNLALAGHPQFGEIAKQQLQMQQKKQELTQKEREFGHKETSKYAEQLRENYDQSQEVLSAIKVGRKALKEGGSGLNARNAAFKYLDKKNSPWKNLFQTEDSQALLSASKSLSGGFKQLFGSKPTQAEFFWYENILPDILKKPEVNEAALKYFEDVAKVNEKAQLIADDIIKENKGYRPIDLDRRVREKMQDDLGKIVKKGYELAGNESVSVRAPNGAIKSIPMNKVEAALAAGGELVE